jgi:hypothetical protein
MSQSPAWNLSLCVMPGTRLFRLSSDGGEKIIELIRAGQTFAEALLFMGTGRYPICAAALTEAQIISIGAADFAAMLRDSIELTIAKRDALTATIGFSSDQDEVTWNGSASDYAAKGAEAGVLSQPNEDLRSLCELLVYGIKDVAKVLIETFDIKPIGNVEEDVTAMMAAA